MTCPYCSAWLATSDEMIATRVRNMAATPGASPFPCPQCNGTDWAISRERIEAKEGEPKKKQWWRSPPSWRVLRACNFAIAALALAVVAWTGPSWITLVWAALGGYHLSQGFNCTQAMRKQKNFDSLLDCCKQTQEINNDLIAGKLSVHVIAHDDPPIAPKLH